jgi:6-phosphogluconolactonase
VSQYGASDSAVEVIVHPDAEALASSVAARLITSIIDAQVRYGDAAVVLTGGGMGTRSQQAAAANPAARAVAWDQVDFYWGDERFVAADDPDRNEKQARDAMLDALPIDHARVHAMPATGGAWGDDPDAAAAAHAAQLAQVAAAQGVTGVLAIPRFDVLMLGVGPDAHIASLFPDHGDTTIVDRTVIPVRNSPKPPPTRLSFTFPVICSATEVWLVAAGAEKAEALAEALAPGADRNRFPAAGAVGTQRTLALIDAEAAAALPAELRRRS